ncbi:MAG: bifunctional metallophosphatase/5'-nucleotidase [Gaiellaceae bacterium]
MNWRTQLALVAVAVAVVLVAPLASPNKASADVVIAGARSLSDQVSVSFDQLPPGHTAKEVHLLAFNDLHGTLDPMSQTQYGQFAGGAAFLAKKVNDLQAQYDAYQATIFAGDNIGASPLASALFHDEPTVVASNLMDVDFASIGNHEFDEGSAELLRVQNGGCHPTDGCQAAPYALAGGGTTNTFPGADFQYLSANVVVTATGKPLFPPYAIKQFSSTDGKHKYKVGFIGETLEATPTIVTPSGVAGLTFLDEAEAANQAAAELADQGVKIPILVVHQGGFQSPAPAAVNGCAGNLAGSDIAEIAGRLDPSIKVIVSAHTHAEYRCTITAGGVTRLITSASSFGRILSDLTLTIDENNDKLLGAEANNILIRNATNTPGAGVVRAPDLSLADPQVQALVGQYVAAAAPLANQVIGRIQGDLTPAQNALGESTIGDVIADAQLAATAPVGFGEAKLAFMNPGGIRGGVGFLVNGQVAGSEGPGEVTYGEAFTVQPFGNTLVTKTMTGAMIRSLLEQQFPGCGGQATKRILQISSTFSYEQNPAGATCASRIGRMWVNGVEVTPASTYRVTMNNFLASGGDGFTVFNQGTAPLGGAIDLDALVVYFGANEPAGIAVPPLSRIVPIP